MNKHLLTVAIAAAAYFTWTQAKPLYFAFVATLDQWRMVTAR